MSSLRVRCATSPYSAVKDPYTVDQLKQENVLAQWQKWSGEFITTEQWLVTLYNELTGKKTGEFIKHN